MIEYHVRRIDHDNSALLEASLNEEAKEGWRLVSTAAENTGGITCVYLFFEREVEAHDRLEDAVAAMDAGERRQLMDVAVAQGEFARSSEESRADSVYDAQHKDGS